VPCLCKGGSGEDEGMGPLRSPPGRGGVLSPACHPEPQRKVYRAGYRDTTLRITMFPFNPEQSEESRALGSEMLRGVYTEQSECAQHDNRVLALPAVF